MKRPTIHLDFRTTRKARNTHARDCNHNAHSTTCRCFFSSRRRHTICLSDWSSDVCSSDLIEFRDTRNGVLDIVDFDAEMIEPAGAPVAARNHVHADIAVAQHDRACRPGLARRLHAEEGLVEPAVQRVLVGRDGDVIDARGHAPPPRRNDQAGATAGAASPGNSEPRASSSAINALLCAGVSSTSGGLTVAQFGSRPKCAMTAFSAAIIGYFCMMPRVAVMSF